MLLIGFSTFPQQSTKESVNRMMEIPRLPDYQSYDGNSTTA
jgi:hypothetical protein